ncbi:MAG TPA: hypothetical protein VKV17_02335 [Bryobacteraceae bacterium]|nr:hypothetical protein [Bryobacteraceae bacterium]
MNTRIFAIVASTLALECAAFVTAAKAQGPIYDNIEVNLPYTVHIGDRTLEPGKYWIKEVPSQSKNMALAIFGHNGKQFETTVITMRAFSVVTPDETTVTLHHIANDYYFDRIKIEGKNYGYDFPLPSSVKQRELELQPVSVAATYEATPAPEVAQAPPPSTPAPQAAPAPAPAPAPPEANRELPTTSLGWLMLLLGGGVLSGAGLWVRRWA